jgi:hypothetical protein
VPPGLGTVKHQVALCRSASATQALMKGEASGWPLWLCCQQPCSGSLARVVYPLWDKDSHTAWL